MAVGGDLVAHLVEFCGLLRRDGVAVTPREALDAAAALGVIDLTDPDEFYWSLRAALRVRRRDLPAFDRVFWPYWRDRRLAEWSDPGPIGAPGRWLAVAAGMVESPGPREEAAVEARGVALGYSPEAGLGARRFAELTDAELAAAEDALVALARRLAPRRTRRWTPAVSGLRVDVRHSFRRSLRLGGELLDLARRRRARVERRVVLLCDASASMDPYRRFLVTFMLAFRRALDAEVFAFNTSLFRLTPLVGGDDVRAAVARLEREAKGWPGGTRIGACLHDFALHHAAACLAPGSVVVVVSDGLDSGEIELLEDALRRIRSRAWRIVWLNPLLEDARYEPTARGMRAALAYIDQFAPLSNLAALELALS